MGQDFLNIELILSCLFFVPFLLNRPFCFCFFFYFVFLFHFCLPLCALSLSLPLFISLFCVFLLFISTTRTIALTLCLFFSVSSSFFYMVSHNMLRMCQGKHLFKEKKSGLRLPLIYTKALNRSNYQVRLSDLPSNIRTMIYNK